MHIREGIEGAYILTAFSLALRSSMLQYVDLRLMAYFTLHEASSCTCVKFAVHCT